MAEIPLHLQLIFSLDLYIYWLIKGNPVAHHLKINL